LYPDKKNISPGESIYLWGANEGSLRELRKISTDDYVVDVKNKEVFQILKFCFWYETKDSKLQNHVGWDIEKTQGERRLYKYVYFLKYQPFITYADKAYFSKAFAFESNPHWLIGQRYFDDSEIEQAMERIPTNNLVEFLRLMDEEEKAKYIKELDVITELINRFKKIEIHTIKNIERLEKYRKEIVAINIRAQNFKNKYAHKNWSSWDHPLGDNLSLHIRTIDVQIESLKKDQVKEDREDNRLDTATTTSQKERQIQIAEKANKISITAIGIAILALIVSILAYCI